MSDAESTPRVDGPRFSTRLRLEQWKPGLRWFAAEFLVVVSGILVALWLQAWFQSRQQADREIEYLRSLAAELRQTEATIETTRASARQLERASAMLIQSFYPRVVVSEDSIQQWLFQVQSFSAIGLSLSTARALSTQEAGFVQDDSLRTAILDLIEQSDQFHSSQQSGITAFFNYIPRLMEKVSFTQTLTWRYTEAARDSLLRARDLPALPVPAGAIAHPFPVDVAALRRDREMFRTIEGLYQIHASFTRSQGRMLNQVRALREHVERVLERRGA